MNRRTFIKLSALAAAPMILPGRILGAASPSNLVNTAILGTGNRGGGQFLDGVSRFINEHRIVALCDCNKTNLNKALLRLNKYYSKELNTNWTGTKAYTDFREVLARPDIDAVFIITPDQWHIHMAIYAIQAGKDVYVEKPLGISMSWAWKLEQIVRDYSAVFQYGCQQRAGAQFRYACEVALNGYLGQIRHIDMWAPSQISGRIAAYQKLHTQTNEIPVPDTIDYDMWLGPAPWSPYTPVRATTNGAFHIYDNCLGFIAGWGAHSVDIAQWGNGTDHTAPVEYEGTGTIPKSGAFDTLTSWDVRGKYANGTTYHFMDELTANPIVAKYRPTMNHGTTFHGDNGDWISVNRGGLYASKESLKKITFKSGDKRLPPAELSHQMHFVRCVKTRTQPYGTITSACNSDLICHLSDIAIRTASPIKWDNATRQIADNPVAQAMLDRPQRAPWII